MSEESVEELFLLAAAGDSLAWNRLVDRFAPLVWSVTRSFWMDPHTASDVFQEVWTKLAENIGAIRDPARLPGWLATTTRREAIRVMRSGQREQPDEDPARTMFEPDQAGLRAVLDEETAVLVEVFQTLDDRSQTLLRLLMADAKVSYTHIAEVMDMPVGSIGPTRARVLQKLRGEMIRRGFA